MPLFNVTIEGVYVVSAQDADAAQSQAQMMLDGIWHTGAELKAIHAARILSAADLGDGWTPDCLPYGVSGNRSIEEILRDDA